MLKVEIYYWDDTSTIKYFDSYKKLGWWINTEGDSVSDWRVLSENG